jgi:hypothetical protein
MPNTVVDRLHDEFTAIVQAIDPQQVSLRSTAEEVFRKALLLAAASHFEKIVVEAVRRMVSTHSNDCETIVELVTRKALSRQYHTLFQWDKRQANSFFSLFGEGFQKYMKSRVDEDRSLDDSIVAFLELGNDRNRLVHQDFGNFVLEKTVDEVYDTFKRACTFVDGICELFSHYLAGVDIARNKTAS